MMGIGAEIAAEEDAEYCVGYYPAVAVFGEAERCGFDYFFFREVLVELQ